MLGVLRLLEPRFVKKEEVIYLAIEEVEEMYFIMDGTVDIGFECSRKAKFVLRLPKRNVIGAFNATFNKKTMFIYKASSEVNSYIIRKRQWVEHIDNPDFKDIATTLKYNVKKNFFSCIKDRIILQQ